MHWLQTLDLNLFRFINQTLSNPVFDAVMPWFSGNPIFFPMVLLAAAIFIWRGRMKALLWVLILIIVVGLGDGVLCNSIKKLNARPRPFESLAETRLPAGKSHSASMPSSHAANWFAATMVLFLWRRRSIWIMLPLALIISFSRVYNGVHYPSDVLAGAILGAGWAAAFVIALNAAWRWAGKKWFPLWWEKMPSLVLIHSSDRNLSSNETDQTAQIEQHWLRAGFFFIAVFTLIRWLYIASGSIELSEDEAYQWLWSKHLALSYYSKPPLIAYTQFLGTSLWGDNVFGVRFFSPLLAAAAGVLLLRFFAREVNARAGFFLMLIITATPLLAVGSTLMTVDPLSVFFWTAAMLAGWRAIHDDSRTIDWLWVGLWMGLGFLSKYTALFQWLCWAVFLLLWPPARKQFRRPGPYLALLVNLICMLPVIVWNSRHGWPTVAHVVMANAALDKPWQPTLKHLEDFVGGNFGLWNPIFFTGMVVVAVVFWRRHRNDLRLVYFFSMGAPLFLSYLGWTLHSRVELNWIAPAILPLLCMMVIYWDARRRDGLRPVKFWLTVGLATGFIFVVLMHETTLVKKIAGRPLPQKFELLTRVRGWKNMANTVGKAREKLLAEGKPVFIIGDHYGITSQIAFNLPAAKARVRNDPIVYCRWSSGIRNQFDFWPGYEDRKGQNAIFVDETSDAKLPSQRLLDEFESVTDLGLHKIYYRDRVFHTIQIFECRNLR